MGRKKKLPEDYAKEHEEEFEVKVIWKDLVGLGDSSIKVPESALVCKYCDTFVKPKGSRISEHLISARHNEMKKRAAGKVGSNLRFLPNLQLKLEQQSVCAQELVRALAIAGVTQPSSVPAVLSLTKGQKGGLYQEVWDMKNVMETYLPVVFSKYQTQDLATILKGKRLNLYIDNTIEINNIPGVALYSKYYDTVVDVHKEILLDVSPLPVCDNKVLAAYISFLSRSLVYPGVKSLQSV
ncbi:uncharacterized protein LOC134821719 [Bolinopsis microptera]|uniref:uncharacterized protein LOC134821719 n=1 Tax=Bolinopsis microptera TaxID=2820187 RepID=UPI003078E6C6